MYTGPIAINQNTRYRIAAYKDGMAYSQRLNINATVAVPHVHDLTHEPAKAATATAQGNREYYVCAQCGKWFSDAEGTVEILYKSSVIIPATGGGQPSQGGIHTSSPTGDSGNPALWLMLAVLSLTGIAAVFAGKRRRVK